MFHNTDIYDNEYIIAALQSIREKGIAPFAEVKADVEREVRIEKKAETLIEQLKGATASATTLQMIADKLQTQVKEAKSVNYSAYSIPGLGFEPEVQAYLASTPAQQISQPIKGKAGVYVIQVKNVVNTAGDADVNREKAMLMRSNQSRVNYQVFNALKEAAEIKDKRAEFY